MAEEITNSKENNNSVVLGAKTESEITEKDLAEFCEMVYQEIDLLKITSPDSDEFAEIWTAAFVHQQAFNTLRKSVHDQLGTSAIFARDKGELVGYCIVSVERDTDPTGNTFIGVRRNYQRRGIATMLLQATHQQLQSLGITSYQTNARESVLKLYDKLGIRFTIQPQIQGSIGYQVTVHL